MDGQQGWLGERLSEFVSCYERDDNVLIVGLLEEIMTARIVCSLSMLALLGGCSGSDLTGLADVATPANGLLVSVSVPGQCLVGGCDPVSMEFNHLGLITLKNTGSVKVFVPLCGTLPAMGTQQFVDGKWINVGPVASCVYGPPSMVIAPHDSLRFNSFFAVGIWRMSVGAATDTALVNEGLSTSAPALVK
jgi:hypothetical protein